jgi:hypothetical protein
MKSYLDFPAVEGELEWESEDYDLFHQNRTEAWTVITTSHNLMELYDFTHDTAKHDFHDGRMFQHLMVKKSANAMQSLYWLVKHHQYDAARSQARFLFETYLIMRALNRDQMEAAEKWASIREEAREDVQDPDLKPLQEQPDVLHGLARSERDRVEDKHQDTTAYSDLWELLSNRGSHPASIKGASVNSRYSPDSEDSIFRIALAFAFGITAQYVRTFGQTPTRRRLQNLSDHVFVEIKLALYPSGLPTVFGPEMYFWDPLRFASPFTKDDEFVPDT